MLVMLVVRDLVEFRGSMSRMASRSNLDSTWTLENKQCVDEINMEFCVDEINMV